VVGFVVLVAPAVVNTAVFSWKVKNDYHSRKEASPNHRASHKSDLSDFRSYSLFQFVILDNSFILNYSYVSVFTNFQQRIILKNLLW